MSERELYPWEVRPPVSAPEAPQAPSQLVEVDDEAEDVPEDEESED